MKDTTSRERIGKCTRSSSTLKIQQKRANPRRNKNISPLLLENVQKMMEWTTVSIVATTPLWGIERKKKTGKKETENWRIYIVCFERYRTYKYRMAFLFSQHFIHQSVRLSVAMNLKVQVIKTGTASRQEYGMAWMSVAERESATKKTESIFNRFSGFGKLNFVRSRRMCINIQQSERNGRGDMNGDILNILATHK